MELYLNNVNVPTETFTGAHCRTPLFTSVILNKTAHVHHFLVPPRYRYSSMSLLHTPAQEVAVSLLQAGCQPPLKLQEEETDPYPVAFCGACFCIWLCSAWLQHIYSIVQFKMSKILFILFYLCFLSCSTLSCLSTTVHLTHYCFYSHMPQDTEQHYHSLESCLFALGELKSNIKCHFRKKKQIITVFAAARS